MLKSIHIIIIGIALGAAGGFAYWYYIGCNTGYCPITSIWYHSTAYGALMGGFAGSIFQRNGKSGENPDDGQIPD